VGRVDDEQVFYLMSRGVPELEAKHLIVYGFFQEVLDQISFEELRDELSAAARAKVR
jgi:Fe-S cluster assembly protein SufD